jgi:hypothetical protein
MMNLLGAAGGALGGAYGALSGDAEEEAKKRALMNLHQSFAGGQYAPPQAPIESPNVLGAMAQGAGKSLLGGALSDQKPGEEEQPWYKSMARGFLGK